MLYRKKTLPALIVLLFFTSSALAQKLASFSDYVIYNNTVLALTNHGKIRTIDYNGINDKSNSIHSDTGIVALATDRNGNVVIGNNFKAIKKYNAEKKIWEFIGGYDGKLYGIVFDHSNECYLITDKGIEELATHKCYLTDSSINHAVTFSHGWAKPDCFFTDKQDNIWVGYDFGEWGGAIFIFHTNTKQFTLPKGNFSLDPVRALFEDENHVYASGGLQHMSLLLGFVLQFNNFAGSTLYESESDKNGNMGEYIGPACYNSFNHSIYYYSQNGFFKGDLKSDLSKHENWKKIAKPELKWENGRSNAVGSPINVIKITPIDANKFIFLSQLDGIGYFDGDKIKMFK